MKINYQVRKLTHRERVILWLNFFEFKKIKTNSKGFDIYCSPYSYHNTIILRKKSMGFRYFEVVTIQIPSKMTWFNKRRTHIQTFTFKKVFSGKMFTQDIDLSAIDSQETLCKYIVKSNRCP